MKNFGKMTKVSLVVAALGWMTAGCENREVEIAQPTSLSCKLQQYAATSVEGTAEAGRAERTSYEYDAQNRLLKSISSVSNPGGSSLTTTVEYQYDELGFLTNTTSKTTTRFATASGKMSTREKLQMISYTYQNGRLATYIATSSGTVLAATTVKGAYEYDEAGNLLTETAQNTYEIDAATTRVRPLA